jgi:hypothetical protein
VEVEFGGEVFFWRGPSPFHFVRVDEPGAAALHDAAPDVTYGWGMIPVTAHVGATTWTTSLFPKDGGYLLPLKVVVRRAEGIDVGDVVDVRLEVDDLPPEAR